MANWFKQLTQTVVKNSKYNSVESLLRQIQAGSFYKMSDMRTDSTLQTIRNTVDTMRALATDSQVSTVLNYYAADSTTTNSSGQIIWATPKDPNRKQAADIVNEKFKRWNINKYARDHILELATVGNLYLPTTHFYRTETNGRRHVSVSLDHNSVRDDDYDIVSNTKLDPKNIIHIWQQGQPKGFVYQPDEQLTDIAIYPEEAVIHFALGGLLGDYTISSRTKDGQDEEYDVQFGTPMLSRAIQPTQTLNLLEDATLLASLSRMVRFLNVDCGNAEEEEVQATLTTLKSMIEQQMSLNTANGDVQSYVNPQSPNNLIFLPKVNGQDAISITDLDMSAISDADNTLLNYYQDKKLSVFGVPKEALNFSSAEGLGGAGSVMSQRSALYANLLQILMTAYMEGWRTAINNYFNSKNLSGFVDDYELHMNPILTELSTINFDRRDAAIGQAQAIVELMKALGISDNEDYVKAVTEMLAEVLPATGTNVSGWNVNIDAAGGDEGAI